MKQRGTTSHLQLGKQGEDFVAAYLVQEGYTILARNYTARGGEIDIIARCCDTIACIEVKTRAADYFALSEVVTPLKQKNIIIAARRYLYEQQLVDVVLRFDVALVNSALQPWELTYLPNAFTASSEF